MTRFAFLALRSAVADPPKAAVLSVVSSLAAAEPAAATACAALDGVRS
ncbi:hypothetical protein [Streptomyces sp. Ru73]|nr:hypothetical protein [Streptomyces sp. Ru73]